MKDNGFKSGWLSWFSAPVTVADIDQYLSGSWNNGFVAFSTTEKAWSDSDDIKRLTELLHADTADLEKGFLMEAGLWRKNGKDTFEELSIEREGKGFFLQRWLLKTAEAQGELQGELGDMRSCYYREAKTFIRGNLKVFPGNLLTFEVVVPEERLNFFITKGE